MTGVCLPISIDEVSYYNNSFIGDLIITQGAVYFFPQAESQSREQGKGEVLIGMVEHTGLIGSGLSLIGELLSKELRTINNSALHKNGLWKQFDSNEEFRSRLDAYIESLKQKRGVEEFSTLLPRPIRITQGEIKKLSVTLRGRLLIETTYDRHDFDIGLKRKRKLVEALKEGSLISQDDA